MRTKSKKAAKIVEMREILAARYKNVDIWILIEMLISRMSNKEIAEEFYANGEVKRISLQD